MTVFLFICNITFNITSVISDFAISLQHTTLDVVKRASIAGIVWMLFCGMSYIIQAMYPEYSLEGYMMTLILFIGVAWISIFAAIKTYSR